MMDNIGTWGYVHPLDPDFDPVIERERKRRIAKKEKEEERRNKLNRKHLIKKSGLSLKDLKKHHYSIDSKGFIQKNNYTLGHIEEDGFIIIEYQTLHGFNTNGYHYTAYNQSMIQQNKYAIKLAKKLYHEGFRIKEYPSSTNVHDFLEVTISKFENMILEANLTKKLFEN